MSAMTSFDTRHPESELLPYLDGELPARRARQVRRHVESCWDCRTHLEELQRTVSDCVRYSKYGLGGVLPSPPSPWADLSRGFARIDQAAAAKTRFSRPLVRWTVLAASAAALVAASLTFRPWEAVRGREPRPPLAAPVPPQKDYPSAGTSARPNGLPSAEPGRAPDSKPIALQASLGDELRVVAALHRLGADLGEPIAVEREGNRVVVRGAGLPPAFQQQIRQALDSLPNVELRFPEAAVLSQPAPPLPSTGAAPVAPPAVASRLEEALGGHVRFESFSAELLDRQETAMARVYAIRRLAVEFPPQVENQLDTGERQLLSNVAREHLAALSRELASIEETASPVLTSLGASVPVLPPSRPQAGWQGVAEALFASARRMDTLLAGQLGVAPANTDASRLPQDLWMALAEVRSSVQQCELLLTR
jgi:hypothetical protein